MWDIAHHMADNRCENSKPVQWWWGGGSLSSNSTYLHFGFLFVELAVETGLWSRGLLYQCSDAKVSQSHTVCATSSDANLFTRGVSNGHCPLPNKLLDV